MTFKLIAPKAIRAQLSKAVVLKREVTISALFHGVVCSNVAFAFDMQREDAADFDTVLRQMLPIAFDKKMNGYKFDDKKAIKTAETLGLDITAVRAQFKDGDAEAREALVQAFYDAAMAFYDANAKAKKADDLSADDKRMNALSKIKSGVKAAKDNGATDRDIVDMLVSMGVQVQAALMVLPPVEIEQAA